MNTTTWKNVLQFLNTLNEEQLSQSVSLYCEDQEIRTIKLVEGPQILVGELLTYDGLKSLLAEDMNEEELTSPAIFETSEIIFPVGGIHITKENDELDMLDPNHVYFKEARK